MPSNIEWTEETWNPILGCRKKSKGCENCYAIPIAVNLANHPDKKISQQYAGLTKNFNWTGKVNKAPKHKFEKPFTWKDSRMVFVNSMSDLFHPEVPDEWIKEVFNIMARCKQHTFQILTKSPDRMNMFVKSSNFLTNNPLNNVWLGVSVEDQFTVEKRIQLLLDTPAKIHFISYEPALDYIVLKDYLPPMSECRTKDLDNETHTALRQMANIALRENNGDMIDWIVCGGESGTKARPCYLEHLENVVAEARAVSVPVFVKQLGRIPMIFDYDLDRFVMHPITDKKGGKFDEFPPSLQFREIPETVKIQESLF